MKNLLFLLFVTFSFSKTSDILDFSGEPPLSNSPGPGACLFNPELSNLNEFWTWNCQMEGEPFYGVTSPDIPNKEVYWLSEDDWKFVFVNTYLNDYEIEWENIIEEVKQAQKDPEESKAVNSNGSHGPVPSGQNSDVIITINGKDLIITAQNIEKKWSELFGDMEGHEVATSTFDKGKEPGIAAFCPQSKTMLAQVLSKALKGNTKAKNAMKNLIKKSISERKKPIHKRCVKTSLNLRKRSIITHKLIKKLKRKAVKFSKLQVKTKKLSKKAQNKCKNAKSTKSKNTSKLCKVAVKFKQKSLKMDEKANKYRQDLKAKLDSHKRQVTREKNREKTCLVNPIEISKDSSKKRNNIIKTDGRLKKESKAITKANAVQLLGSKDASKFK